MTIEVIIKGDNAAQLIDEMVHLMGVLVNGGPGPSLQQLQKTQQAVGDAFGVPVRATGNGGMAFDGAGTGAGAGGGPVVHPPDMRAAINASAAAGKDELAKQRAAKAAATAAQKAADAAKAETPPETAKKKRGRPAGATAAAARASAPAGTDLQGDAEDGDNLLDPETDLTADPLAVAETPAADGRTPAERRNALIEVLNPVYKKNAAGKAAVMDLVQHFGCKIPLVPDDRVDELWERTEKLCRKFGLPFVDEDDPMV